MASTTAFALVTPAGLKFEGHAEIVVAPGKAGDLAALPKHAPLLTTLRTGVLRTNAVGLAPTEPDEKSGMRRIEYAVNGGFMEILPEKVVVLTDVALSAQEVDVSRARADHKQAEEALAQKRGVDDRAEREAAAWATARLEVAHQQVS